MGDVEELKKRLRKLPMTVRGREVYLAEGDLLLDENELATYEPASDPPVIPIGPKDELVGILENGLVVCWRPGTVLSYCVLKGFTDKQHEQIVGDMFTATQAWEATCGVKFEHRKQHDRATTKPDDVVFSVQLVDAGGEFIAAAFFPNDPPIKRVVSIDPSHFTQKTFDSVGVLRHELGHVLGFRHEHIRTGAPAACPKENRAKTINFTDYDPQSVMHYFCGNVGSRTLDITDRDRAASRSIYGLPLSAVQFMDP